MIEIYVVCIKFSNESSKRLRQFSPLSSRIGLGTIYFVAISIFQSLANKDFAVPVKITRSGVDIVNSQIKSPAKTAIACCSSLEDALAKSEIRQLYTSIAERAILHSRSSLIMNKVYTTLILPLY